MSVEVEASWKDYRDKPDNWYNRVDGWQIADNILSWQSEEGSWPKNTDTMSKGFSRDKDSKIKGTFDNGATVDEMRFLARISRVTDDSRYKEAFLKGLGHILKAQYPTGGWPQSYPPGRHYPRHITFNDNTMVNIMRLLREIATLSDYSFVDGELRKAAQAAFDKGIDCILKCQIRVDDRLTVWCSQHDEVTLQPRPARIYELVSLSGSESAGILRLLMEVDDPDPNIIRAVKAGAEWYETAKLEGIEQIKKDGDTIITKNPEAPAMWARFYEIETNTPFFCGRDGIKKYSLSEIERERRIGYSWYGQWGKAVADDYQKWKLKLDDKN